MKNMIRLGCFFVLGFMVHSANAQSCSYSSFNEHHAYVAEYNACINKVFQAVDCNPLKDKQQDIGKLKKAVFALCGRHAGQFMEDLLKDQKVDGHTRRNCHRNFGEYIVTKRDDVFAFNLEDKKEECARRKRIQDAQANTPRPSNGNGAYLNSQGIQ